MDNNIIDSFKSMSINNKQCIICNNIFTLLFSGLLSIKLVKKYNV